MQVKKVLKYTAIAFVIFFLYSRPAAAADAVHNVFNGVETGANRIATFCTQVLQ
jgi:hypothetical protein